MPGCAANWALSGEGLVGFAGPSSALAARNVIAGLWDVNDQSTAVLRDTLYAEVVAAVPALYRVAVSSHSKRITLAGSALAALRAGQKAATAEVTMSSSPVQTIAHAFIPLPPGSNARHT